tara:strand:+ start:486 stop:803 length:318 start_codon:yes stop_codon:yes gene_type:complete
MDNELIYGDPGADPITNPNASDKINNEEEVSLAEIYANATLITSEPIIPGEAFNLETTLAPTADVNGAAAGKSSSSKLSGFSQQTLDIVKSDNTAGQKIFLTKSV